MKVLLQRVKRAAVRVDDETVSSIGHGLLALVGIERGDSERDVSYYADKTAELRIFPDGRHGMNSSVEDAGGAVMVVSQFTLAATTRRGRRPSFAGAAPPEVAEPLYLAFAERLRQRGLSVSTGAFQAMMEVELVNDGPVTILLEPMPEAS